MKKIQKKKQNEVEKRKERNEKRKKKKKGNEKRKRKNVEPFEETVNGISHEHGRNQYS